MLIASLISFEIAFALNSTPTDFSIQTGAGNGSMSGSNVIKDLMKIDFSFWGDLMEQH